MRDERVKEIVGAMKAESYGPDGVDVSNELADTSWKAIEDAIRLAVSEAYDNGATKLEHYAAGLQALGGKGATALAAAKMVRGLKDLLARH